ncbi:MAG: polysaccharide deacetylase family protein [Ruminococcus sp.]
MGRSYSVGGAAGKAGNCENRENAKEVQEYTCAGREQEGAQKGNGKREEKTVSDKVIGARNRRSEKKLEDTLEKNVTEKKKAALTFDDGPNSKYTPLLLKGLKERGVHATFFLMGKNIEGKEALVKQIQEEGHLIGNHTYNHVQLDKISKEAAKEEIETTNQKIFEITGVYPAWLRPPYGEWRKIWIFMWRCFLYSGMWILWTGRVKM